MNEGPIAESDAGRRLMHALKDCGGCAGQGAHRRWCPYAVGEQAAYWGQMSETAGALGDKIGPNDPGAANMAWQLAATLRANAERSRVTSPGRPSITEAQARQLLEHRDSNPVAKRLTTNVTPPGQGGT